MSLTPHKKPLRMAALVAGAALVGAVGTPNLAYAATTVKTTPKVVVKADTATTVVSRLSFAKGPASGAYQVVVTGKKLATWDAENEEWVAKTVKFGTKTATAEALSEDALLVDVPSAAGSTKEQMSVLVLAGDATKGPKFSYVVDPIETDSGQEWTAVSEDGKTGLFFLGENFDAKLTKVLVGGKAVAFTLDSAKEKLTFAAPAGLMGVQDVVVTDGRKVLNDTYPQDSYLVGTVAYSPKPISVTATSTTKALNEAATVVKLTGTALDLVTGATFGGEKAGLKKIDATHVDVTIAKGAAKTGTIKLTTKYLATAESAEIVRAASAKPTVSATTAITAAGGEVTLTGTNFTGLKTVTLTAVTGGKVYAGSKITVVSDTSAKVTFPAVPNNAAYKLKVTNLGTTASDEFAVTVGTIATTTTVAPTTTVDPTEAPTP